MAILSSRQSGNFTDASTWYVVDQTSYLDSRVNAGTLTTSPTSTTTFSPGSITVAGIVLQLFGRASSPTGTITVRLFNNTTSSIVKGVTINVSDLPNTGATTTSYIGWTFFEFDSSITLVAGNVYVISAFTSSANQVSVYRNATTNNWSRGLVTTTTASPASTDTIIVSGEYISTGVNSPMTVTMNNTSSTTYGNVYIGSGGSVNYGVADTTNYRLRFAGDLFVGFGGTFTIGTQDSPMPSTSTATLEMSCTSIGQFSIRSYGAFIAQGASKVIKTKLNGDVSIGATSSITSDVTNWSNGDVIVVPSTTRTSSQFETITLNSNAVGNTITHNAYTFAHGGNSTTLVQADLSNLTRNVKIFNTNTATRGYVFFANASNATIRYVEFYDWGYTHATSSVMSHGIGFAHTNAGTAIFEFNSYYATSRLSYSAFSLTYTNGVSNNNVFYFLSTYTSAGTTPINAILNDDNIFVGLGGFANINGSIGNRNIITSAANHGISGACFRLGDNYDNAFYANGSLAIYMQLNTGIGTLTCYNLKSWRNNTGIGIYGTTINASRKDTFYIFENLQMFGNSDNFGFQNTMAKILINNSYFWGGDALHRTIYGVSINVSLGQFQQVDSVYFNNCKFGLDYLNNQNPFSSSCVFATPGSNIIFNSCNFNGTENTIYTTFVTNPTYSNIGFVSLNHNGVEGSYRLFSRTFNIISDSVYTYTGSKSMRIIPASSSIKAFTQNVRIPAKKGKSYTLSVKVRESANVIDTQYNGNPPRLMWSYNPIAGNLNETVCDTYPNYNLITQPEDMSNTHVLLQSTIPGTFEQSPIGLNNAAKIVINNGATLNYSGFGTATGICTNSFSTFSGDRNISFYVKYAGFNLARISIGGSTSLSSQIYVDINLETGNMVGTNASNPLIENVGDGWYRVSLDVTSVSATNNQFAVTVRDTVKTTGNGVDGVLVWGAQLTESSGVQEYIPFGTWQTLEYTTPVMPYDTVLDFYVDCDGTVGFVNVDGWKSTGENSRSNDYWFQNGPYIEADWTQPGGNLTFVT